MNKVWLPKLHVRWFIAWIVLVLCLHVVTMMVFEKLDAFDALWLTTTTIMTVGYGDLSAKTVEGRLSTMVLLYAGGVFTLAWLVNKINYLNQTARDHKRRGQWKWNMKDHIVFISPRTTEHEGFVGNVMQQLRLAGDRRQAVLMSLGASDRIELAFEMLDIAVVRSTRAPFKERHITNACIGDASLVVILNSDDAVDSSFTINMLDIVREKYPSVKIIVETQQEDRARALRLGATTAVRRFRSYPEHMAHEIITPHSGQFVEDLFSYEARATLLLVDWSFTGRWRQLVQKAVQRGIGTPLGYLTKSGALRSHPQFSDRVATSKVYVVSNEPEAAQAKVGKD